MEEYISKSSLLSEIEKLKGKVSDGSSYCNGWQHALRMLELSLNTLEMKEVDLEKELQRFNKEITDDNGFFNPLDIAKHFFELGLKV